MLQTLHGLSDREAAEAVTFDLRWKAACGYAIDAAGFHPTSPTRQAELARTGLLQQSPRDSRLPLSGWHPAAAVLSQVGPGRFGDLAADNVDGESDGSGR